MKKPEMRALNPRGMVPIFVEEFVGTRRRAQAADWAQRLPPATAHRRRDPDGRLAATS